MSGESSIEHDQDNPQAATSAQTTVPEENSDDSDDDGSDLSSAINQAKRKKLYKKSKAVHPKALRRQAGRPRSNSA